MTKKERGAIEIEALKKDEREMEIAWEKTVKDGDYFISELRVAFDQVQNKDNWKSPVDAMILTKNVKITEAAIIHYTGSVATFTRIDGNNTRVRAAGYYAAIGA